MYHLQGRPIKDVALEMERTEGSVQKLLARALICLQSILKGLL